MAKKTTNKKSKTKKTIDVSNVDAIMEDMKNLALRIQDELTETMMYINPEEMKQIIREENDEGVMVMKMW